jgi:hypothetical protein
MIFGGGSKLSLWRLRACSTCVQVVMHDVMDALSAVVKHPDFARKAMSLLGKLGGRNHAHINDAQDLAYKANPEQGLRATLTFTKPTTTFLLPLDRIIAFVTGDPGDAPVSTTPHFRRQAFEFVRTCLATMMSLGGQVAAPAAPADTEGAEAEPAGAGGGKQPAEGDRSKAKGQEAGDGKADTCPTLGEQVDDGAWKQDGAKLVALLVGKMPRSSTPAAAGVAARTKLQQLAEESCFQVRCHMSVLSIHQNAAFKPHLLSMAPEPLLFTAPLCAALTESHAPVIFIRRRKEVHVSCTQTLFSAALAATVDNDVAPVAEPFVTGVCTHLALLYACGHCPSQQELGVGGSWVRGTPTQAPGASISPRDLNMRVAFQGLIAVLTDRDERRIAAGVKAVDTFVASLLVAVEAQRALGAGPAGTAGTAAKTEPPAAGADAGAGAKAASAAGPAKAEGAAKAEASAAVAGKGDAGDGVQVGSTGGGAASTGRSSAHEGKIQPPLPPATPPSRQAGLPPVLDDLVSHVLHACHGDTWGSRIGGIGGLKVITKRLPRAYLKPWAPQLVAAIAKVLAALPEHATSEVALVAKLLKEVVLKVAVPEGPAAAPAGAAAMEVDGEGVAGEGAAATALLVRLPHTAIRPQGFDWPAAGEVHCSVTTRGSQDPQVLALGSESADVTSTW